MAPKAPLSLGCALHSLHLCEVLLNTSEESSKILSVTTDSTIWLWTEQFTLCYVTDVPTDTANYYIRLFRETFEFRSTMRNGWIQ